MLLKLGKSRSFQPHLGCLSTKCYPWNIENGDQRTTTSSIEGKLLNHTKNTHTTAPRIDKHKHIKTRQRKKLRGEIMTKDLLPRNRFWQRVALLWTRHRDIARRRRPEQTHLPWAPQINVRLCGKNHSANTQSSTITQAGEHISFVEATAQADRLSKQQKLLFASCFAEQTRAIWQQGINNNKDLLDSKTQLCNKTLLGSKI